MEAAQHQSEKAAKHTRWDMLWCSAEGTCKYSRRVLSIVLSSHVKEKDAVKPGQKLPLFSHISICKLCSRRLWWMHTDKSRGAEHVLLQPSATDSESWAWEQSPPSGAIVPDSWTLWEADTCPGLGGCQLFDAAEAACKACGGGKGWRSPSFGCQLPKRSLAQEVMWQLWLKRAWEEATAGKGSSRAGFVFSKWKLEQHLLQWELRCGQAPLLRWILLWGEPQEWPTLTHAEDNYWAIQQTPHMLHWGRNLDSKALLSANRQPDSKEPSEGAGNAAGTASTCKISS